MLVQTQPRRAPGAAMERMDNTFIKRRLAGNIKIDEKSTGKVDGAVALVAGSGNGNLNGERTQCTTIAGCLFCRR